MRLDRALEEAHVIDARAILADNLTGTIAPCVTSSFQAGGVVLLHMLRELAPAIPVLFLDTVHHFSQTYEYRDAIVDRWQLNLVNVRAGEPSPGLWQTDPHACCARHKVGPLFAELERHDVWFTALRREQSPSRAALRQVEAFSLPSGRILRKVSPLAGWTNEDVLDYARAHSIPLLPLYEVGYTSIGCEPCTSRPIDPSNPRSGRWQGQKLECGIHLQKQPDGH